MNRFTTFAATSAASIVVAGLAAAPAYAWHPVGSINKSVYNQTEGGNAADANTDKDAVSVHTGDVLVYTVTVSNTGSADSKGQNDMVGTKLTDTLPNGIELVGDAKTRTVTENIGTIKPGQKVTKHYSVKVTSTSNGSVLMNKACFTGNSGNNDSAQKGCDVALIKIATSAVKAATAPAQTQPSVMPNTGASVVSPVSIAASVTAAAVTYIVVIRRKLNA